MELFRLYVNVRESVAMESQDAKIYMLLFDGYCEGEYFNGKVLPGGVDTQIHSGERHSLSARYIVEGVDKEGKECRIFIENNASMNLNGETVTTPKIYTNSEALKWLEQKELSGRLLFEDGKVIIAVSVADTEE